VPPETIAHLLAAYGSRTVTFGLASTARLAVRQSPATYSSSVRNWHGPARGDGVDLSDAAVRRTPLGAVGFPGEAAAARAAEIVGAELGWSLDRKREEIEAFRRFYDPIRSA
jgi:hypothetical protein